MKTILLSNKYDGKAMQILKDAVADEFNLKILSEVTQGELIKEVAEADYIISSGRLKIDKAVIDSATNLKMVQRTGVGTDQIDLEYLQEKGIPLYVNRGINATSVAEYTVMLILSALKKNYYVNCQMRAGIWKKQETALETHELKGKTVGIIGMGNIGKAVAKMLTGFDVNLVYYDKVRLSQSEEQQLSLTFLEFSDLLSASDIVTLHCPYNAEQGYLIAETELSEMKDGTILINTSRGGLIRQEAVVEALKSGKLSAVGIDVFETEPLSEITEYAAFDNAVVSPHIAGLSYETFKRMLQTAVDNIRAFDRGDRESIKDSLYFV